MHAVQAAYRELHDALLAYEGGSLYPDLLAPWLAANPGEPAWLAGFARRRGDPIPGADQVDLWRLYALSRAG